MPIFIHPHRVRLRMLLQRQLKLMHKTDTSQAQLLQEAIEGLMALEYGEALSIFTPGDRRGSHDGTRPYTLRKLKMQALGFADLLIANKYKKAIHTVAAAFGEEEDTFIGWRKSKRLAKTADSLMKSFRERVAKLNWNETEILNQLKQAGKDYRVQKKLAW
ncbi:MAG: hypothetical protein ACLP0B_14720 [Steroidobacteraceae bacterium]